MHLSLTVVDANPKICSFEATIVQNKGEVSRQDAAEPPKQRDPAKARAVDPAAVVTLGWAFVLFSALVQ